MANQCENTLTVLPGDGDDGESALESFRGKIIEAAGDTDDIDLLGIFYPVPEEAAADPTAWTREAWGTKSEVNANVDDLDDEEKIVLWFDSAWTPPIAWLTKVAADYPHLIFKLQYDEPGEAFMGVAAAVGGVLEHASVEYC